MEMINIHGVYKYGVSTQAEMSHLLEDYDFWKVA